MEETFPGRVVRGITVRHQTLGNCAPDYARFNLDFEPLPDGRAGYEFVDSLDYGFDKGDQTIHEECAPSISGGVLLNLTGMPCPRHTLLTDTHAVPRPIDRLDGNADGPLIAVRVVLTEVRYHGVDSAAPFHLYAGWHAAHKLRSVLAGASQPGTVLFPS